MKHDKQKEQMKNMTVAFIGHREIKNIDRVLRWLKIYIRDLIEKENAETFLFTDKGKFDVLSYDVVTIFKSFYYPNLRRIYVRAKDEIVSEGYEKYLLDKYDETFFPEKVKGAGYRAYVKRNQIMIDMCDVLVTCCDESYKLLGGRKSGTKAAVEYALQKKKPIICIRDIEK